MRTNRREFLGGAFNTTAGVLLAGAAMAAEPKPSPRGGLKVGLYSIFALDDFAPTLRTH